MDESPFYSSLSPHEVYRLAKARMGEGGHSLVDQRQIDDAGQRFVGRAAEVIGKLPRAIEGFPPTNVVGRAMSIYPGGVTDDEVRAAGIQVGAGQFMLSPLASAPFAALTNGAAMRRKGPAIPLAEATAHPPRNGTPFIFDDGRPAMPSGYVSPPQRAVNELRAMNNANVARGQPPPPPPVLSPELQKEVAKVRTHAEYQAVLDQGRRAGRHPSEIEGMRSTMLAANPAVAAAELAARSATHMARQARGTAPPMPGDTRSMVSDFEAQIVQAMSSGMTRGEFMRQNRALVDANPDLFKAALDRASIRVRGANYAHNAWRTGPILRTRDGRTFIGGRERPGKITEHGE